MVTQLTLFDCAELTMATKIDSIESELARASDPVTSHLSAVVTTSKITLLRLEFLRALKAIGPATANEVAAHASDDFSHRESIRKRARELVDSGFIRVVDKRKCRATGSVAQVYEMVMTLEEIR